MNVSPTWNRTPTVPPALTSTPAAGWIAKLPSLKLAPYTPLTVALEVARPSSTCAK